MFLPMLNFVDGTMCVCNKNRGPPRLDQYGHHLTTGCSCGGYRHRLHDEVKYEINGLLRYSGYRTKVEEFGVLNQFIANAPIVNTNKRTDITVYNHDGVHQRTLLDVSIPSTIHYRGGGAEMAAVNTENGVGKSAEKADQLKKTKYGEACRALGFGFKTIIIESCGLMHKDTSRFLLSLAKNCCAEKRLSAQTLYNFYLKSVSVRLQRGLAGAILEKYHYVSGHGFVENGVTDRAVRSLVERVH